MSAVNLDRCGACGEWVGAGRRDFLLIPESVRAWSRGVLAPVARGMDAIHISPCTLTVMGIVPAIIAGYAFAKGMLKLGGVLVAVSGIFDLMDGLVARMAGRETRFGALLDSTIDRYSEIAVFVGLAVLFRETSTLYGVVLALCGSLMVSYLKARAEGLGQSCTAGMLQRPERMIVVVIGALLGMGFLKGAIWIIAVLANITAIERLLRVRLKMGASE
jgi:CDP-diacylglycerol--glycerol-3-phosphate 3-phosphatidyltransferase